MEALIILIAIVAIIWIPALFDMAVSRTRYELKLRVGHVSF